jgi:hypothetical protein|tara:strand:- start:229 stop:396 length:168 start_codon:yes stop_codon:yes gene_type:complete
MKNREEIARKVAPSLVSLIWKVVKFSKGGLDKAERQELAGDLIELAYEILEEVVD